MSEDTGNLSMGFPGETLRWDDVRPLRLDEWMEKVDADVAALAKRLAELEKTAARLVEVMEVCLE